MIEFADPAALSSSGSTTSNSTDAPPPRYSPTAQSPRPLASLRTSFKNLHDFATVVVGSGETPQTKATFTVHKALLVAASPFFAAALNGAFTEGLEQMVSLPEEKPDVFEWFIWWLYTGSLTSPVVGGACINAAAPAHTTSSRSPLPSSTTALFSPLGPLHAQHSPSHASTHPRPTAPTHHDGDLRNAHGSPKYFLLLDLYSLSDHLLTTSLSNAILDTIARLSEATNSVPTPSDTWILYEGSIRESAPVRRLVLDLFAYKKTDKLLETHRDEWNPRFLRDLVVKLKRGAAVGAPAGNPGRGGNGGGGGGGASNGYGYGDGNGLSGDPIDRHALVPWRPASWSASRACEGCRDVVKPGVGGERCAVCERVYCALCVRCGRGGGVLGGEVGACKPWLRGACARYHEHGDEIGGVLE